DVVARAGDIAEEVRLALGAGGIERRRLFAQPGEHLAERLLDPGLDLAEAFALDVAAAGLFEVAQLLDELLIAEGPLQRPEEAVESAVEPTALRQRAAEQREAAVDARLLAGDASRRAVVRTRIGDAAADHVAILVEQHRLSGGGAQIDADEGFHRAAPHAAARPAARFCSII